MAAFSRSKSEMEPAPLCSDPESGRPEPDRVMEGIQFSCGKLSSAVSSTLTIFDSGFMNIDRQFSVVVFPAATPPATRTEARFSITYQKYAAMSEEMVL